MIEIGKSYTIEQVVTPEMTARAIGSGGLEVFGTPFMMAMMEHAAMDCVQPDLPEGKGTVGVDIQSSHLAPTPVGMTVRATATVTGVSENGKLITFRVEASELPKREESGALLPLFAMPAKKVVPPLQKLLQSEDGNRII